MRALRASKSFETGSVHQRNFNGRPTRPRQVHLQLVRRVRSVYLGLRYTELSARSLKLRSCSSFFQTLVSLPALSRSRCSWSLAIFHRLLTAYVFKRARERARARTYVQVCMQLVRGIQEERARERERGQDPCAERARRQTRAYLFMQTDYGAG